MQIKNYVIAGLIVVVIILCIWVTKIEWNDYKVDFRDNITKQVTKQVTREVVNNIALEQAQTGNIIWLGQGVNNTFIPTPVSLRKLCGLE